jgi:hypothetical protein
MPESSEGSVAVLDQTLDSVNRVGQALTHAASALELQLVDVALDPNLAQGESRQRLTRIAQALADMSGVCNVLVSDISQAAGIPVQAEGNGQEAGNDSDDAITAPAAVLSSAGPEESEKQAEIAIKNADLPSSEELYSKVIDLSLMPEVETPSEELVFANIVSDKEIEIGKHRIKLEGHDLYLFNAMLLLRDKAQEPSELREMGFNAQGTKDSVRHTFSKVFKNLAARINGVAGEVIIRQDNHGRATRYAVNPKLVLLDLRNQEAEEKPADELAGIPDAFLDT